MSDYSFRVDISDLRYDITGFYWIDPNGGCLMDAFQVHCGFEDGGCATCIDAKEWVSIFSHKNLPLSCSPPVLSLATRFS